MTPSPPSSYMLRELKEVPIPDPVGWWPQALGWQLLLILLTILTVYVIYQRVEHWWCNRYRREAIEALARLSSDDALWPQKMHKIVKVVMVYLDSKNAAVYGQSLLCQMDNYHQGNVNMAQNADFVQWMICLEDPKATNPDFTAMRAALRAWLLNHRLPEKAQ
ncbi:DUF4381 domain-containing protein [Vibrio fluvialis]|uniref:DUF4381 domain-containing protein n=1 Tax=Vibrio fluvialis TaxID=676 RepID=UPI001C9D548B|nr:DUF4381 domain-containing protein [Vibrio fluvialis]MBY7960860.1 DUF4381 domain-containing protein [Vibrio fluvialis]MBY7964024.1 DUF4381 domain-containing protein [Vibrio fluvialis]MBY8075451.1 DUF4381 domain-containing protein [Vibrio fluvialis]WMN54279.1 DUF4381 domain-containing protein [Vibrio fluvialis]HDM8049160.1 DUF4381 domain-containing protein [Vibrio fluvialis]